MGHHLFTSPCEYPHAKSECPDGSSPGGRKQPLVSIIAFKNKKRNPSGLEGLAVELSSGETPPLSKLVLAPWLQGTRRQSRGKLW